MYRRLYMILYSYLIELTKTLTSKAVKRRVPFRPVGDAINIRNLSDKAETSVPLVSRL
jgi:hypothetical protein